MGWKIKHFRTLDAQNAWIAANRARVQFDVLFVNNGFAVQYRKLRRIG